MGTRGAFGDTIKKQVLVGLTCGLERMRFGLVCFWGANGIIDGQCRREKRLSADVEHSVKGVTERNKREDDVEIICEI